MPGNLCEHCVGYCCRYIALPIETPEDHSDFDDIRWYLLHEGVAVFIEDGEWFINMQTNCRHLMEDNRCGIYATRPRICREYTTDNCDYHSGDYGWEQHFTCPEHLDEYAVEFLANKRKPRTKSESSKSTRGRPRLKVKSKSTATRKSKRRSLASVDTRGVPLPVLEIDR